MSSDFGARKKATKCHRGVDLVSAGGDSSGNDIVAVNDGKVITANTDNNWGGGFGLHIIIQHCNKLYTWYGHFMPGTITVHVGQQVTAGQLLGKSDSTGHSDGAHLHFSVAYGDSKNYIDPFMVMPDLFQHGNSGSIPKGATAAERQANLSKDPCVQAGDWIYNWDQIK